MAAARSFFRRTLEQVGEAPDRVTSDKEASYPGAISKELGQDVKHRTSRYLNNMIEQDHRGIKQRYGPMRGFLKRFCETFDELRNFYKTAKRGERVSLGDRRSDYRAKTELLMHGLTHAA
jgi:transposase-like protein